METGKTVIVNNMPSYFRDSTKKDDVSSRKTKTYNFKGELEWQRRIGQEAANE